MKFRWIVAAESLVAGEHSHTMGGLLGHLDGSRDWHPITTAPFNHAVEARVRGPHGLQALPFPCRQTASGWINSDLGIHMAIEPVAWRAWPHAA
ncbi:MAG TPA: hypothetical protein VII40_05455 [Xanthobacteraceae bacterium]